MSYEKVSLLLPMNGANNGTVFTDFSPVPKTATPTNLITVTDANSPYGSSAEFNGTNRRLQVPHDSSFMFPAATDFCIEAEVEFDSIAASRCICSRWGSGGAATNAWMFYWVQATSQLAFEFRDSAGSSYISTVRASWSPSTGVRYKVAVSREGTTYRFFADGALLGTVVEAANIRQVSLPLDVGVLLLGTPSQWMNGHMNDLRITTDAAVRTAAYTPETRLTGFIENSAVGASKILDINGDPVARTLVAVPRSYWVSKTAPPRQFFTDSDVNGDFSMQVPAGLEYSVLALADEATLRNDIVHRVIPV